MDVGPGPVESVAADGTLDLGLVGRDRDPNVLTETIKIPRRLDAGDRFAKTSGRIIHLLLLISVEPFI